MEARGNIQEDGIWEEKEDMERGKDMVGDGETKEERAIPGGEREVQEERGCIGLMGRKDRRIKGDGNRRGDGEPGSCSA